MVRAEDPEAWRTLVRLYGPLVFYWCSQMGLRGDDAADAGQEVFAAVSQAIDRFHKERPEDSFRAWLRTITRNKVRDFLRTRAHEGPATGGSDYQLLLNQLPAPDAEESQEEVAAGNALLLQEALELLRGEFEPKTWQAFWHTVNGQSPQQVAEELGTTAMAVRQAKSRVLRRLRESLADTTPL